MLTTVWAIVRNGKIELTEEVSLTEGARLLVTLLPLDEESQFWMGASQSALDSVWNNPQDDVYAQLLEK
jgi:hypothetical protein